MRLVLFVCMCFFGVAQAQCVAQSGPHTAALVELYTSEGCSSCPPAKRWLSSLGVRGQVPGRVVPIALHVDYRDYIGWKDPYAKRDLPLRQRRLTTQQRLALAYTPQVVLQGREFARWGTAAFDEALAQINARPAQAHIRVEIVSLDKGTLEVVATARLPQSVPMEDVALYLAAYESRGGTLPRDYVVLEWQGPYASDGKALEARRRLPLLPKALPANSGVVAFVQNRRTAEVLQALMRPAC